MKRSLNEIGGMVMKAARGAGVPLGHCEDLAAASVFLAATDPARLNAVMDALSGPFENAQTSEDGTTMICANARAVMAGPAAIDALRCGAEKIILQNIDAPRVVVAMCGALGLSVQHKFEGTDMHVSLASDGAVVQPTAQAVTVSELLWDQLAALAAKTYVPATEASRLSGAGAGLTDND